MTDVLLGSVVCERGKFFRFVWLGRNVGHAFLSSYSKPIVMSFKFALGLILGAAAGAAIMHYLDTEEGKAFVKKIKRDLNDLEENLADLKDDLVEKGKSAFGGAGVGENEAVI
jgi:hypothetical protein